MCLNARICELYSVNNSKLHCVPCQGCQPIDGILQKDTLQQDVRRSVGNQRGPKCSEQFAKVFENLVFAHNGVINNVGKLFIQVLNNFCHVGLFHVGLLECGTIPAGVNNKGNELCKSLLVITFIGANPFIHSHAHFVAFVAYTCYEKNELQLNVPNMDLGSSLSIMGCEGASSSPSSFFFLPRFLVALPPLPYKSVL